MPDAKFCRRCGTSTSQEILKDGDLSKVAPEQLQFADSKKMVKKDIESLLELAIVRAHSDL